MIPDDLLKIVICIGLGHVITLAFGLLCGFALGLDRAADLARCRCKDPA
ncbi:hypothetical protein SAMN04489712_104133 [Thermomonospora echinospora]|uniref:Uncharacterized protein n=1 Tax=Thermomonospora echinospora TaxID=1992 RepID=A0A1H5YSW6_9ACTN|nr:hypothetical protein [Thermomonospora echinospora]SEG26406.1 hypothetical protein SAMN04489712_104133 [Thermomonospora echinospora]